MCLSEKERKLRDVVRVDFTKHIKPLVETKKCASCESKKDLSIHHVKPLSVITKEVYDEYSNILDVEDMRELILCQQLKEFNAGRLVVLCTTCHTIVHEVYYDYEDFNQNDVSGYVKEKYLENQERRLVANVGINQRRIEINRFLKGLFLSNIVYYFPEERRDLIKMISKITNEYNLNDCCDEINDLLIDYSSQYIFEEFQTNIGNRTYKKAWRVIKIVNEGKTKAEKNIIKAENDVLIRKIGKSMNAHLNDSYNRKSKYYNKEMRQNLLQSLSQVADRDIENLSEANSILKKTKSDFRIMSSKGKVDGKHRAQVWQIKKLS